LVFTGTYEHTIDAKNRLAIPADIRSQILDESTRGGEGAKGGGPVFVYITLGEDQSLNLYTEARFEQRSAELDRSELPAEKLLEYEQVMYSLTGRVEIDQQGRVRLPDHLLQKSGLKSEVTLIGVKDHLEIHDRTQWRERLEKVLSENRGLLMNPRRAMK
jgi:MraZ protein